MKHLFQTIFCGALLLAALVFAGGTASAHTMPDSEWRLLFDAVGGDGAGVIEFGVGMPLQYAEDFLGSGFDEEEKAIESLRLVYYKYRFAAHTKRVPAKSQETISKSFRWYFSVKIQELKPKAQTDWRTFLNRK